jgi:polyisoprenoid-binding protein YceI
MLGAAGSEREPRNSTELAGYPSLTGKQRNTAVTSSTDPASTTEVPTPSISGYVAGTWTIDPVHTHVGFVIKHMMVSKVRGRFTRFSGTITTAASLLDSAVTAEIEVASIDTDNDTRDNHIRSADFFDAEHHPTMTFASTAVRYRDDKLLVEGHLTIRGTTRTVTLTVDEFGFGPNPAGGTKAGFSATTEINRSDFGVSYNGPIPGGGMALGERVQIVLDVEADLTDPTPSA